MRAGLSLGGGGREIATGGTGLDTGDNERPGGENNCSLSILPCLAICCCLWGKNGILGFRLSACLGFASVSVWG